MTAIITIFGGWFAAGLVAWLAFVGAGYRFESTRASVPTPAPGTDALTIH